VEIEGYCGTTLKIALVVETYTNPAAPSMRLSRLPWPPL